ncbi:MAG: PPC domain-containing DNA-binding protein [Patescibacteria group bacterium]
MLTYTFRLRSGDDLRQSIEDYIKNRQINAGVVVSLVGSLKISCLRVDGVKEFTSGGPFEIVSATGTLSQDGVHIHLSLADRYGKVTGGHLKHGCIVHTTAEVVIGHIIEDTYYRVTDPYTGHKELEVESPNTIKTTDNNLSRSD